MQTGNQVFGFNPNVASPVKIGEYGAGEADCVSLGRTGGGVEISPETEMVYVENDQDPGPTGIKEIRREIKIKLSMVEVTLENLALAFNLDSGSIVDSKMTIKAPASGERYRELWMYVDGPDGKSYKISYTKCSVLSGGAHSFKKDDKTVIELELTALCDTDKKFGTYEQIATDTTPPTVALTTPVDGGTVVKDTKGVVIWTISEIADASTIIYGDTFSIINTTVPASASLVPGSVAYSSAAKTVTFTPTNNWTASDTFQVIVSTGLKDFAGNKLAATKIEQFSVTV